MQLHKKGVLIVTLVLVLVIGTGTVAMAATGSLTQIEKKWINVQELVLKKMVKEGQLTQEQADEQLTQMKEHLQASSEDDVYIRISHGIGKRAGFMGIMTDAWAELTGHDPGNIRASCQEQGTTVWELAKQAGQEEALKQKILVLVEEKLDTLVQDGKITDEKKTKILDGMKKKLDDESFPAGFMGGCHGKHD